MLKLDAFKEIVEKSATPLLVVTPKYLKDGSIGDFELSFANEAFSKRFPNLVGTYEYYSQAVKKLTIQQEWLTMAKKAMESKDVVNWIFYSDVAQAYFKVSMNTAGEDLLSISLSDITDNMKSAQMLEHLAFHDELTGLKNFRQLKIDLENMIISRKNSKANFGIIMFNIDNMKYINDSQGRAAGDQLIINAGNILKRFETNKHIKAYRTAGDDFVVLVNDIDSKDTLLNTGDVLLEIFNADGIQFSAGISVYPDDSENAEELIKFADMAMYDVKKKSKNDLGFFQATMQERFLGRLKIQNRLNNALENNSFQLYYQPQFDVASGKLRGFEALLRWHDAELGWINPEQFIPIAEETRLVVDIGDWVMRTALASLAAWKEKFGFDGIMSVNVSPVQLKKPTFIFDLAEMMRANHTDPKNLEIEITEGMLIENKEEAISILRQIRDMGIGVSLDDFGTGYSSLSYLQALPITTLKIDKSFISNITSEDGVEANITDSIVSMVTKMGLDTIAEGVEKPEQLKLLHDIKCHNIQGFLKGKPMSFDRCEKVLSGDESAFLTIENDTEEDKK